MTTVAITGFDENLDGPLRGKGHRIDPGATVEARWLTKPQQEDAMAKGESKGNREAKKPKADKNVSKSTGSAYKQAQAKSGTTPTPFAKKKS